MVISWFSVIVSYGVVCGLTWCSIRGGGGVEGGGGVTLAKGDGWDGVTMGDYFDRLDILDVSMVDGRPRVSFPIGLEGLVLRALKLLIEKLKIVQYLY